MDKYHSEKNVMTKSGLDRLAKTPSKYYAWINEKIEEEETPALRDGRLLHLATLQPDIFARDYFGIIEPNFGDCRKKENKAVRDAWRASNPNWNSPHNLGSEYDRYIRIAQRVHNHPTASRILSQGEPEKEFRRTIETIECDTVECKCRFDWINDNAVNKYGEPITIVADLKFVREDGASPEKFWWHVRDYRYAYQEAFYGKIKPFNVWYFIVVEKTVPYDMAVYVLPKHLIIDADIEIDKELQLYADCMKENKWPSYPVTPRELEDPRRSTQ